MPKLQVLMIIALSTLAASCATGHPSPQANSLGALVDGFAAAREDALGMAMTALEYDGVIVPHEPGRSRVLSDAILDDINGYRPRTLFRFSTEPCSPRSSLMPRFPTGKGIRKPPGGHQTRASPFRSSWTRPSPHASALCVSGNAALSADRLSRYRPPFLPGDPDHALAADCCHHAHLRRRDGASRARHGRHPCRRPLALPRCQDQRRREDRAGEVDLHRDLGASGSGLAGHDRRVDHGRDLQGHGRNFPDDDHRVLSGRDGAASSTRPGALARAPRGWARSP